MFNTIDFLYNQKRDFLNFKIIYHCIKCGKKISTTWNKDYTIDGNFIAADATWSEILDCVVNDPQGIICVKCLKR
jgi:hypothetical protein